MKKGNLIASLIIILIVFSYLVLAAHTATVSLTGYAPNYETNNMQFAVKVENTVWPANNIVNVTLSYPGYSKTYVIPNWQYDGDINWYSGSIAPLGSQTFNFTITVNEAETSIPNTFYIGYDDNNLRTDNGTILTYLTLAKSSDSAYYVIWNPAQSLSPYIDYRFINLSDAAGNSYSEGINFPHHLYIDNQKPSITLNQLDNNFLTNNLNQSFNFNASDNSFATLGQGFSPELNC